MLVKEHKHPDGRIVIVVCDKDLIGKKFSEGNKQLDLTSEFYQGKEMDTLLIGDVLRNADSINLVGTKATQLGIQEGIIEEKEISVIEGVPFAIATIEKAF
ncbi:DUF424 family protein [Candidatus Woesearchaeota archaeon]|nr:DUF424 family protein [Candidatus Woesearchaeota archaeon]